MSDLGVQFSSRQEVLDAILGATEARQSAWEEWFAVRDVDSPEYESARLAYLSANSELNRLVEIDDRFRALR